jgi:hypothetical protein
VLIMSYLVTTLMTTFGLPVITSHRPGRWFGSSLACRVDPAFDGLDQSGCAPLAVSRRR